MQNTTQAPQSSAGAHCYTLDDYDVWYQECEHCGDDTAKSTPPKDGIERCWKCGRRVIRDFSERALKRPR